MKHVGIKRGMNKQVRMGVVSGKRLAVVANKLT